MIVAVEEVNNHYVKREMKDSINAIFLPAFAGALGGFLMLLWSVECY